MSALRHEWKRGHGTGKQCAHCHMMVGRVSATVAVGLCRTRVHAALMAANERADRAVAWSKRWKAAAHHYRAEWLTVAVRYVLERVEWTLRADKAIGMLRGMLQEADRLRGWLQTDYPKTAGGSLIIPGITDKDRRALLCGTSMDARAWLAALITTAAPEPR